MNSKLYQLFFPGQQFEDLALTKSVDALLLSAAYRRLPLAVILTCSAIVLFGPLCYQYVFHNAWLLIWIAVLLANSGLYAWFYRGFSRAELQPDSEKIWHRKLVGLNAVSGLSWSFGPVLLPGSPFEGLHAGILLVTLLLVSGVVVALVVGHRQAMLAYLLAAHVPVAVSFILEGGPIANTLALLLVTAIGVFLAVGSDFNQAFRRQYETQKALAQSAQEASFAKEKAEKSSSMKSQFVATVSHEIRTPIHTVLGMLKLLQSAELNERQAGYTSKVETTVKSLVGLLDDILDFSKIEADQVELSPHPFRIDRMLHDLSVVLLGKVQSKPLEVMYDIDPAIPKVLLGDVMRLRQVLINLAANAVQFTERGEVVLQIRQLRQTALDCTLHFEVKDTGVGIAPENLEKIFSEFSQTGDTRQARAGLGLSISRRLVAMMGGELEVISTPGVGSTFYFDITFQSLQSSADALHHARSQNNNLQVLVVEGGNTARALACAMCRSWWGWSVESAASGEEAISLVQKRNARQLAPFDLVIVDWTLPGIDGWQTIGALQAVKDGAPLHFLMVSRYGQERLLERPMADVDRLSGFLSKPFTASMLFNAMVQARGTAVSKPMGLVEPMVYAQRLKDVRVLVVEDNLMNQQVVKELLELEGAIVEVVNNGQQAVELLAGAGLNKAAQFDAVLMDLQMPHMDGYAATRIIRKELGLHNLPVIALTAHMMQGDKQSILSAGMNAHIGKPFNIDLLVRIIKKEHAVTKA